ncbi:multicopper oxidase domain-containing protein [Streptomyces sp. NPDC057027]|uniref:multicopper oxidase domain-containing protein n=1 Tax=Streptomyces sp. NPDC057027 TaxID=3346004 RepID=UPI00364085B0
MVDPDFVNHTLRLGAVERWTVRTDETLPAHSHPFHLHTNQVLLTHRKGRRPDPPVRHDAIRLSGGRAASGTRTSPARTIAHCHQLQPEDPGMMQTVHHVRTRELNRVPLGHRTMTNL